jgi:glycerophosphoryl diester phosphodiesterase
LGLETFAVVTHRFSLFVALLTPGLAIVTAWAAEPPAEFFRPVDPPRAVQVVARGGLAVAAPENGRRALEMAIEDGLEWVAVDVRRSQDGRHVLFADERLDAKTNGRGMVKDHTLTQLQALDAGSWFAPRFASARIVSLADCLKLIKNKINVCLVCHDVDPAELAKEIQTAGVEPQVLVQADRATIGKLNELSGGKIRGLLRWQSTDAPATFDAGPAAAVAFTGKELTAERGQALRDRQLLVLVDARGSFDQPSGWKQLIDAGARFVLTDRPAEALVHVLSQSIPKRPVQVACHRGASRYAPENTLPAYTTAYAMRADYVEFDVRPSSDGKYFLLHDGRLDRTTNQKGPIRDFPAATIATLDAGSWFSRTFAGTRVPTLDEFLSAVPPEVQLYFDAKDIRPEDLAVALARHNLTRQTVVYQSADYLGRLKAIDETIRRMPPARNTADVDRLVATIKPFAVDTPWKAVSKQYLDHCHAAGVQVFSDAPYGVTVEAFEQAIAWGIDLVQTDYPLRVWRAMERIAAKNRAHEQP